MRNPLYDVIIGNVVNSIVDFNHAASSIQHKEPVELIPLEPVELQSKQVEIEPSISAPIPIQNSLIQELKTNPIPIQEVSTEIQDIISPSETLDIQAVVTRGMLAKMDKPLKPLK